jgi:hypothetical protein
LTLWQGRNPFTLTLPLIFDGFADGISQENNLRMMTWMSQPSDDTGEPYGVTIFGKLPFPATVLGRIWVINGIEYGDDVIWDEIEVGNLQRVRQDVVLTLVTMVRSDYTAFTDPGEGVTLTTLPAYIKTVKGDTLRSLAFFWYHDSSLWKLIADANPVSLPSPDPAKELPEGISLRIPKRPKS